MKIKKTGAEMLAQFFGKKWLFVLGLLLFACSGLADHFSGPEIDASLFYFPTVVFFTLVFDIYFGIAASIASTVLFLFLDFCSRHPYAHPAIPYLNAFLQFLALIFVVLVFLKLQKELRREKQYGIALKAAKEETERLAKIKSDFCSMVSHELRTPMSTIRESINLIDDGLVGPVNEAERPYLAMAKRNIDRLIHLINNVLDFSKLDEGKKELHFQENDLNKTIAESVQFYKPLAAKKGLNLSCELDEKLSPVLCDEDCVGEVLSNVIGNAIKFTEKGGIMVRTRSLEEEVQVSVQDSGCGIPQNGMKRLFQHFEQIPSKDGRKPEGSGLGLAISRKLIELHHGKMWVESELDRGTTVYFSLNKNKE